MLPGAVIAKLKSIFPDSEPKFDGNTVKVHIKEINTIDFFYLSELARRVNIKAKRSGTGITLIAISEN